MDTTEGIELVDRGYSSWNRGTDDGSTTAVAVAPLQARKTVREPGPQRQEQRTQTELRQEAISRELAQMQAVVVVGEHSWGDAALENLACRPLMEIAGKPLVQHIMQWLADQGIRRASICANSHARPVRECLGDGRRFGLAVQYYTDVMPRGPAGCVRDAACDSGADTILVICGTLVPRMGASALARQHFQNDAWATVVSCPSESGGVEPAGMYMFSSRVLEHIPPTGYQDIKETLLPQLRRNGGRIELFRAADTDVLRVTDLESYVLANRRVVEGALDSVCGPDYVRNGEAWVHRTCVMHPSVRLVGPVIVGPGCTIEADSVVVGPISIGTACHIGRGAVVSRSTISGWCRIGPGAVVDNSLLFERSVVDAAHHVRNSFWTERPSSTGAPNSGSLLPGARRLAS